MDFLREAAAAAAERPALDDGVRVWSYGDLDARVDGVAHALLDAGVKAGRRVALLLGDGGRTAVAVHAVARAGCVAAPLGLRLTASELARALAVLAPAAVIVDAGTDALAGAALSAAGEGVPLLDLERLEVEGAGRVPRGEARAAKPVASDWAVLWTSGTGGRARGVRLSAASLRASARASRERLDLGPDDRWLLSLAVAHVGGLAIVVRAALTRGLLVARPGFSAKGFNALVDSGLVTHASLVPTMLLRVLDERGDRPCPPTLRCVLLGGARAHGTLVRRALGCGMPLALTYGLTEASSQVATATPEQVRADPDTVGSALPGVEVRIDEQGEILVRGPTVATGYLGVGEPLTDAGGWLHTGDLGELDAEGRLRVTGRRGDRIVSGGVNVDPAEVEDVLRLSDGVRDVAVVGMPDPEWGELVAAAVVRRDGAYPDNSELEALARSRLTSAKIPRRIVFVPELPRNPNGKVDRGAVRALLDEGAAAGATGGDAR